MPEYKYIATGHWKGARRGTIAGDDAQIPALDFAAPPEFNGEAGKWTPEHFFVAALISCFIVTFRAIAEMSKFEFQALEVSAEGSLAKAESGGLRFDRVVLRPKLTLSGNADSERALRLLEKAERGCLISKSVNSEVVLEPTIQTATGA